MDRANDESLISAGQAAARRHKASGLGSGALGPATAFRSRPCFVMNPALCHPVGPPLLTPCLPLGPVYSGKQHQDRAGPDDSNCKNQGDRFLGAHK